MPKLKVTLRYGRLGSGVRIPCSYALELDDGRSVLYQSDTAWPALARALGAPLPLELRLQDEITGAERWLDKRADDEFEVDTDDVPEEWFV